MKSLTKVFCVNCKTYFKCDNISLYNEDTAACSFRDNITVCPHCDSIGMVHFAYTYDNEKRKQGKKRVLI